MIEHTNYERIQREMVQSLQIFFTEDHADGEFSTDEPTITVQEAEDEEPVCVARG